MCKFLDSQYCSIDLYGSVTPFDYCSFVESSEVGECEFSFKIVLAVLGQLNFHMNLRMSLSVSAEKSAGISIGVALNLWITLSFLIKEHH